MTRTGRLSAALAHYAVEILSVLACVTLVAIVAAAAWLSYRQHSESERALLGIMPATWRWCWKCMLAGH